MRVLIVDNFDSFTYNIAQVLGAKGASPSVVRNDRSLDDLRRTNPAAVVISPGPGTPNEAGISMDAIRVFAAERIPVLGVCLGHQCIATIYGGRVGLARPGPVHGKTSLVTHDRSVLFDGISSPFTATRYHSLAVDGDLPDVLTATAWSEDGTIMAMAHSSLPLYGVQFHPESILTVEGPRLLENFLGLARAASGAGATTGTSVSRGFASL